MAVDYTPVTGYGGKVVIGSLTIPFRSWTLNSTGAEIDVTSASQSSGYGMVIPGIVGYTATIEWFADIDTGASDIGDLDAGSTFDSIDFYKDASTKFVSFTNDVESTSTAAGYVTRNTVTCSVEGVLTATIDITLNGGPTYTA